MKDSKKFFKYKKIGYLLFSICFWLIIWQFLAYKINKPIFLPTVNETFSTLFSLVKEKTFWSTISTSFFNIVKGFLLAILTGTFFASISSFSYFIRVLLEPLCKLIKAIPVASFIILALLWTDSNHLSTLISFLMVFPIIYINVLDGLTNFNLEFKELSTIFEMSLRKRIRYIYLPQALPYFLSACKIGLGFSFKSGIAAEIIGIPQKSIGKQLYEAKLYLMTEELFAWTIIIVLLSFLFELIFMTFLKLLSNIILGKYKILKPLKTKNHIESNPIVFSKLSITCKDLTKYYGDKCILDHFNYTFTNQFIYCVTGPSGCGKTTLVKALTHLIPIDCGEIQTNTNVHYSMVFQENRLFESMSVYENIQAVYRQKIPLFTIYNHLLQLHLEKYIQTNVCKLSGGMKRRIAIVRAVLSPHPILILDEPFKGLDHKLKLETIQYIKENTTSKLVIIITHDKEDILLLNAKECALHSVES